MFEFSCEKSLKIIALSDFKYPVTYYLPRRKGRATSKNVEGAQPPPPDSGFSRYRLGAKPLVSINRTDQFYSNFHAPRRKGSYKIETAGL